MSGPKTSALRERTEDIVPLAERFIARFCKQYDRPLVRLTEDAQVKLRRHPWYGNIRELEHAVEKAVIICDDTCLSAELFQFVGRAVPIVRPPSGGIRNTCIYAGRDGEEDDCPGLGYLSG